MKRRKPLQAKQRLQRGTGIKRQTRLKPHNAKRRRALFLRNFGSAQRVDAIKAMACYACGREPAENVHIRSRGAGGTWRDVVDLGRKCHRELDDECGSVEAFEARHPGVDLRARAAFLAEFLRP